MHEIEPYYNWRHLYIADNDIKSPFYGRTYSEFEYDKQIYNYLIHPQWDDIGSETLFIKILYVSYQKKFAIIEFIGEWNDCLNNDIMILKREIIDTLIEHGINKYILIGENVLNFHSSDDSYYEEWSEDIEDGWIAFLNFRSHVLTEFQRANIDYYILLGGKINEISWRTFQPNDLFEKIDHLVAKRLQG
ncbi:MAG: hypothetical protein IT238_00750 [Bacteroidia bacterium]|nr:hypothetical protein [Bacteroidia bacterium]MCZ2248881.1 hypothetical protein [Bacteroidia bacterium]